MPINHSDSLLSKNISDLRLKKVLMNTESVIFKSLKQRFLLRFFLLLLFFLSTTHVVVRNYRSNDREV
jgi:hypothetical protein